MKKFGYLLVFPVIAFSCIMAKADQFIPDFGNMLVIRCDFQETLYNEDGSEVSTTNKHLLFRIDDEYQRIYIQREPITHILNFDTNKIEYNSQSMSDDYIALEHSVIDRISGTYTSAARLTYDNAAYGIRTSKASGTCEVVE